MTDQTVPPNDPKPPEPNPAPPQPKPPAEPEMFSATYVKELREESKQYRKSAAEAKAALEQKARELAEAQEAANKKIAEEVKKANERIIRTELKAAAMKAGMVDLDGLKLADLSTVSVDDKGEVVGAETLIESLKKAKPYLFTVASGNTTQTDAKPPEKAANQPFNALTATPAERLAKAAEMGLSIKTR